MSFNFAGQGCLCSTSDRMLLIKASSEGINRQEMPKDAWNISVGLQQAGQNYLVDLCTYFADNTHHGHIISQ